MKKARYTHSQKEKKPWYKRWGAIVLYVIIFLIIIGKISPDRGFDREKFVRESLEREGIEVISVGNSTGKVVISMKSLGDRQNQVMNTLATIGAAYPSSPEYLIVIQTPEDTCYYNINGDFYRRYINSKENTEEMNLYKTLNSQIEESTNRCS